MKKTLNLRKILLLVAFVGLCATNLGNAQALEIRGDVIYIAPNELPNMTTSSHTATHFGFIAQELREIYPNLVFKDSEGYLSVNYIGMIPVLVETIKELNTRLLAVEGKNFEKGAAVITSEAKLYQNNPNPFTNNTEIKYYLPNETKIGKHSHL